MKLYERMLKEEQGVAIIVAMFMLVILTIIGIAATKTSNIEQQIAMYDMHYKIALYSADSGINYALAALRDEHVEQAISPHNPRPWMVNCPTYEECMGPPDDTARFPASLVPANLPFELYLIRILNEDPYRVEIMSRARPSGASIGNIDAVITAAIDIGISEYTGGMSRGGDDPMTYNPM